MDELLISIGYVTFWIESILGVSSQNDLKLKNEFEKYIW